jgi:hypothetical protein
MDLWIYGFMDLWIYPFANIIFIRWFIYENTLDGVAI